MHRMTVLFLVCSSALLQAQGGETTKKNIAPATGGKQAPNARYSREQLDRLRARLAAQIAVHDLVEGAMRAPTPEEAAALANNKAAGQVEVRWLNGGGVAVRGDQSQLEYVIATQSDDGTVSRSHRGNTRAAGKGASADVR